MARRLPITAVHAFFTKIQAASLKFSDVFAFFLIRAWQVQNHKIAMVGVGMYDRKVIYQVGECEGNVEKAFVV